MTRRLLQVWALLLLGTLLTVLATGLALTLDTPRDLAVVEHSLQGGVGLAVDALDAADGPERERVRQELERRFGYPVELRSPGELPRPVVYESDGEHGVVWGRLASGERVRMGPLPEFELPPARRLLPGLLALLALWGGVGVALTWPQLRTLRAFEAAARQLGEGDWSTRVGQDVPGPARSLAAAFDRMAAEIETHIAARRRTLQVVSHELRTPVTRLQLGVDLFLHAADEAERSHQAEELQRDVEELDALVDELRELVRLERPRPPVPRPLSLAAVLEAVDQARRLDHRITVELPRLPADAPPLHADRRQLERALGNLVSNALRHARARVWLAAERGDGGWWVTVNDDGDGIPEEHRERVWAPFERLGADDGRGCGLGLSIVRRIVEAHGGRVELGTARGGGAAFRSHWPDPAPAPDRLPPSADTDRYTRPTGR